MLLTSSVSFYVKNIFFRHSYFVESTILKAKKNLKLKRKNFSLFQFIPNT